MIGPTWDKLKSFSRTTLAVLFGISIVLSILNSKAVHSVSVTVRDADNEHRDQAIPGMSKEHALPDYRIEVMRKSKSRIKLGTHVNQSAAQTLRWEIQEPIPLTQVTSLRLVDNDKLSNDVLEEVQITGTSFSSQRYRYEVEITRTVSAAFAYFFTMPLGIAIVGALGLAIFLFVIAYLPL